MEATVIADGTSYPVVITWSETSGSRTRVAFDDGAGLNPYVGKETLIAFAGGGTYPLYIQQSDPYSAKEWRYAGYYETGSETW